MKMFLKDCPCYSVVLNERKRKRDRVKSRIEKRIREKHWQGAHHFWREEGRGGNNPFPQRFWGEKNPAVLAKIPFQLPLSVLIGDSPHHTEALWR